MKNDNKNLHWLLSKSSLFVFADALGLYLFLQLFNSLSDGFIAEVFDIKIPLIVAVISGLILVIFYTGQVKSEYPDRKD